MKSKISNGSWHSQYAIGRYSSGVTRKSVKHVVIVLGGTRFFSLNFIIHQEGQTAPVGLLYCVITVVAMVFQDVWNHHVDYMMKSEFTLGVLLLHILLEVETGFSSLVRFSLFIAS